MHAAMVIAVGFALIILAGALLLMLPCAAKSGRATPFIDALFTATSATCVTGLVTVSTAVHWSLFGKCVILLLIQIGGLGFMSVMTAASLLLRRTITLRERMVIGAGFGLDSSGGIVRLMRRVLVGTFLFEGVGAGLLSIRFVQQFGPLRGVGMGVFHAISAFCNGGFDLMGTPDDPFCSLVHYADDPLVNLTIMALIVLGGLGFFVWSDVWDHRRSRRLSLHRKLVLAMSGVLLGGGFVLTLLFEWSNPATLGGMSVPHRLLAAAFQTVTLRTAGFASFDQNALRDVTKAVCDVLMFVGGSSGSTAGGVKTVTVGVLVLAAVGTARGRTHITAFKRTIPQSTVANAGSIALLMLTLGAVGAGTIAVIDGVSFENAIYETISALCTVGLTTGITSGLSLASCLILIIFMFFGRVGIMTISVGFMMANPAEDRITYAQTRVMIG